MRLSALLGAVLGVAVLSGCVDHDSASIVVYGHASPVSPCGERRLTTTTTTLTAGSYNVDYASSGYQLFPIVENRLIDRTTDLSANPNDVRLTEAEVTLLTSSGDVLPTTGPNPFTTIANGLAQTGGVAAPQITAIPISYIGDLKAFVGDGSDTILIRVQILGETLGGVDVVAPEWDYPVDIVTGSAGFQCVGEIPGAQLVGTEGCFQGQDYVADACQSAALIDSVCGGYDVCFPPQETTP